MGHHILIMMYMLLNYVYENPECNWSVCMVAVGWGWSILGLFAHFYWQAYGVKKKTAAATKNA